MQAPGPGSGIFGRVCNSMPSAGLRGRGLLLVTALVLAASVLPAGAQSGLPPAQRYGLVPEREPRVLLEKEWAERLIEALDLGVHLPAEPGDADRFELLCPGAQPQRVARVGRPVPLSRAPGAAPGEGEAWSTAALAPGRYRLAVHGRGAGLWSLAGSPLGVIAPGALSLDVAGAPVQLGDASHPLSVRLADGGRVERVEAVPWTAACIAPATGWRATRPLTFGAKARTMVLALDALERLPRAGQPRLLEAERFARISGDAALTDRLLAVPASAERWVEAVGDSAELVYEFELEESGLHSVLARVHGAGRQIWSLDEVWHAAVAAGEDAPRFAWNAVTTVWLEAGAHTLRARLPRGGGVDVLQLVRRRIDDEAFVAALGSLGLREGAAVEAVDERAARRNLEALVDLLRTRTEPASGLASVEAELEDLYRRPLSPILPGDL